MGSSSTDEELMLAYANGDDSAFAELYQRFERRLFGFLERRLPLGRKHAASDLFQKSWLKIHLARKSFDPAKGLTGWIFTIALNVLRDHVGMASFRLDLDEESAGLQVPSGEDIEKKFLIKEGIQQVEKLLAMLPQSQREILLMSEWDGLSAREIGEVYQLSENAVRQTIFRAKQRIKALQAEQEARR